MFEEFIHSFLVLVYDSEALNRFGFLLLSLSFLIKSFSFFSRKFLEFDVVHDIFIFMEFLPPVLMYK